MAAFQFTHGARFMVVVGSGAFPTDMLRYERAAPATEDDAHAIDGRDPRAVSLVYFVQAPGQAPATARWASFGWRVAWCGDADERAKRLRAAQVEVGL